MSNIPDGFSVIPGAGQAVAEAIVKAVDSSGSSHGDVLYSPTTGGFIVPDAVAKAYKAPADKSGADLNVPASEYGVDPDAASTGILRSYAAGEAPGEVEEPETEDANVPEPTTGKASVEHGAKKPASK